MATKKRERNSAASQLGRLGGLACYKKYGSRHMSKLAKRANEKRWQSKNK